MWRANKKTVSWGVGGVPSQFFTAPTEVLEDLCLICCICTEVLRDPVFTNSHSDCQHSVCKSCLDCYISTVSHERPGCPMCGIEVEVPSRENAFARRQIRTLKVRCLRCLKTQQCSDDGDFVLDHLASCFKIKSLDELPSIYPQLLEIEQQSLKICPMTSATITPVATVKEKVLSCTQRSPLEMISLALTGLFK